MRQAGVLLAALALSCSAAGVRAQLPEAAIPDGERVPGVLNPDVTQENLAQTVCAAGWISGVVPAAAKLERLKAAQMREGGLRGTLADYHEDHRIPLCAGGHPSDPRNLWPQRAGGDWNYRVKDQLEAAVCRTVCRGEMTLEDARAIFREPDWTRAFLKFYQVE
jgi:hypothetical protein